LTKAILILAIAVAVDAGSITTETIAFADDGHLKKSRVENNG